MTSRWRSWWCSQRLGTGRLLACARVRRARALRDLSAGRRGSRRPTCLRRTTRDAARVSVVTAARRTCGGVQGRRDDAGARRRARSLAEPVSEVTAASDRDASLERVVVGTEAIWQHVRRCRRRHLRRLRPVPARTAVLGAPQRDHGRRQGRSTGRFAARRSRRRRPADATKRRPGRASARRCATSIDLIDEDVATAKLLGFAPYGAVAEVSGDGAAAFVARADVSERQRDAIGLRGARQ